LITHSVNIGGLFLEAGCIGNQTEAFDMPNHILAVNKSLEMRRMGCKLFLVCHGLFLHNKTSS
jgi:hypothetical protein